jgi:apolipoprotein N-acyltransferase
MFDEKMHPSPILSPTKTILACILLSGACWWLSFDLYLHWWWPIWIAPAPILYLAPKVKASQAFIMAFLSLLIGRLSWLSYLLSVLPLVPTILFTILYPLIFALLILPARKVILTRPPAIAIFSFPLLWTSFEFLTFLFTRDGTIASFAYTQYDLLPIMQLASVTGIAGITFLISYIPSAIAVYAREKRIRYGLVIALAPAILVLAFGLLRIHSTNDNPYLSVGLVSIAEKDQGKDNDPRAKQEFAIADRYLQATQTAAGRDAGIILLPEKVISVTDSTDQIISATFQQSAKNLGITLIAGYTKINKDNFENQARVFSPQGIQQLNYVKVNLFEGEAIEGFKAGKTPGLFDLLPSPSTPHLSSNAPPTAPQPHPDTSSTQLNPASATSSTQQITIKAGLAICKDLDFAQYMHTYGSQQVSLLFVPAWDFHKDGWWHSRIAMTRGIENGYSLVRNARQGRLTISDEKGRVLAEANSEKGEAAELTGRIQPAASPTIYSRWGDWFGWLNLLIALIIHLPLRRILSFAPRNVRRYRDR